MKIIMWSAIAVITAFFLQTFSAVPEITAGEADKDIRVEIKDTAEKRAADEGYKLLPKPGERVNLDQKHYFIFGFDRQPKMGSVVMKVEIFTLDGRRDTSFNVKGDLDMPSMRGAHSMGEKDFLKSKKGSYLLPVEIVMPGGWEFRFVFVRDGKTVLRGAYLFDV